MPRVSPFDAIGTGFTDPGGAQDCLSLAGLNFDVSLEPVKNSITGEIVLTDADSGQEGPKYFQVIRSDTSDVLGIVEGRFSPLQNRDVFSIADAMIEDGARIIRAAEIERGARCFMTLEWDDEHTLDVRGDVVGRRAIVQNAHNGKYSALVRLMPLRKACENGLVVPLREASFEIRIKHTVGGDERLIEAHEVIRRADDYFRRFQELANRLAGTGLDGGQAEMVVWKIPEFRGRNKSPAVKKKVERIISLFEGEQSGGTMEAVQGTAWGLLNAGAEFADYDEESRVRVTKGTNVDIQRFKSAFGGTNQRLKLGLFEAIMSTAASG
jgi:phage/plasmid-like protein (TIGR03299 family)